MADFQSVAPGYDISSAEDPMDLYQDDRSHPADNDGIDIDLDLTVDREDLDDDEMIEDLEADGEDMIPVTELVQDEQMIDDEEEEGGLVHATVDDGHAEHHQYLDPVEASKVQDGNYVAVDTEQQMPPPATNRLDTTSQITSQQPIQHQDHFDDQFRIDADSPSRIVRSKTDQSIDKEPVAGNFPKSTSAEPSYPPAIPEEKRKATLDQLVDSTHNTQPSSPELTDESRKPPPIPKEQPPYAGLEHGEDFGVVNASLERKDTKTELTAEASAQYARHDAESPRNDTGLLDSSTKMSDTSGRNSFESRLATQDDTIWRINASQTVEEDPDEQVASGTDILPASQPDLAISQLHPVTVKCQGREMYLFPPTEEQKDHDQYLLSDSGLAAEGLQSLFEGFRDFLGESVSDGEGLEISFDDLGLRICESEKIPGPMLMTLSTNIRFVHRLNHLEGLVADGVGLSQLAHGNTSMEYNPLQHPQAPDEIEALAHPIGIIDSGGEAEFTTATDDDQSKQPAQHPLTASPTERSIDNADPSSESGKPLTTSDPTISEIDDLEKATYLTRNREFVDDSATPSTSYPSDIPSQPRPTNATNTLMLQSIDDNGADYSPDEEYEDEEDYDIEENAYPNEENSAGSSTVQGDEAVLFKDEVDDADEADVLEEPFAAPQLQLNSDGNEEAEDVISYDTDEEENGSHAEDKENDHHWQTNEEEYNTDSQDAMAHLNILQNLQSTSSHDMIEVNEDGFDARDNQDVSAQRPESIKSVSDSSDENPHNQSDGGEVGPESRQAEGYLISAGNDQIGFLSEDQPGSSHMIAGNHETGAYDDNYRDDPNMRNSNISGAGTKPMKSSTPDGAHSAEDDDEITFDDEVEDEAVAEGSAGASTGPTVQQTTRSSPGALKRSRGYDEPLDISDDPGKKRVSAGFGRYRAG
ncbi:MAG: hypothetical protein Q9182_001447 [Xanthomendoza sp. 2 TL-2023]